MESYFLYNLLQLQLFFRHDNIADLSCIYIQFLIVPWSDSDYYYNIIYACMTYRLLLTKAMLPQNSARASSARRSWRSARAADRRSRTATWCASASCPGTSTASAAASAAVSSLIPATPGTPSSTASPTTIGNFHAENLPRQLSFCCWRFLERCFISKTIWNQPFICWFRFAFIIMLRTPPLIGYDMFVL